MNFFGGSNCGENIGGIERHDNNCCSLIFLIMLLQSCGGCAMKGINIDSGTILLLLLLSNCSLGCSK